MNVLTRVACMVLVSGDQTITAFGVGDQHGLPIASSYVDESDEHEFM